MSAIASFHVIDRATAGDIASTGDPAAGYEVLRARGRALDADLFSWSGYCMLDLLDYLTEREIPVVTADYRDISAAVQTTAAVLGPAHRPLRSQLDPAAFTSDELVESMSEFEFDAAEAAMAATDGLNALRAGIDALGDGDLLVIIVG